MDIGNLLNGFLGQNQAAGGQASQAASGSSGGSSGGLGSIAQALPGGFAGGAAAGGLVALMLGNKKARKMGGKALKYGGMAVLGGMAYRAYQNHQASKTASPGGAGMAHGQPQAAPAAVPVSGDAPFAPAPAASGFDPAQLQDATGADMRLALIKAMIHAAKSDGHIDAAENQVIREQISAASLAADEKAFLFDQLDGPADPLMIAGLAKDEVQSSELYLASLLTIDLDTAEEARYMERLGDALRLPVGLRTELDAQAAAVRAA